MIPAFWLGVGAVVVYEFLPQIIKAVRPAAVQTMKAGMAAAEQFKGVAVETKESFGDMMAEAKYQYETEKGADGEGEGPRRRKTGKKGK
jgi:hypothetical protein